MREERDFLGKKLIKKEKYYGIHTQRAIDNFSITQYKLDKTLIKSYGYVKLAALETNYQLGYIKEEKYIPIKKSIIELINNKLDKHIIIDPLSGGAGTSINMNINEVIANRALEIAGRKKGDYEYIHPIDDINLHQSTNDTFPTAIKIAILFYLKELEPLIAELQLALQEKEREFADILKLGRTQLQDAVPLTLGRTFSAYASAVSRDRWRIFKINERIKEVNIGGTAIGTGITAPRKYIFLVIEFLRDLTELNLAHADNLIDNTQNMDVFVEISGILKAYATTLYKMSSDLRLMSSNPFSEIILPQKQVGSSIMPGKINPVILEMVNMIAMKVFANDNLITMASSNGQLELNAFLPVISFAILENFKILINSTKSLTKNCIKGIKANKQKALEHILKSNSIITAAVRFIGYKKASELIKKSIKENKNIIEVLKENNLDIDRLLKISELLQLGYNDKEN